MPIEFSWRAFATEAEEKEKKDRLNAQLQTEEADELNEIEQRFLHGTLNEEDDGSLDSDDSYDQNELAAKQQRYRQKAQSALARKYEAIRKAVNEDLMLF